VLPIRIIEVSRASALRVGRKNRDPSPEGLHQGFPAWLEHGRLPVLSRMDVPFYDALARLIPGPGMFVSIRIRV
jgi:hypothetical protein